MGTLVVSGDQGEFNVNLRLPRGTSYQRTEEFTQPIEREILALPALRRVRVNVGPGNAGFGVSMVDLEEREIWALGILDVQRTLELEYPRCGVVDLLQKVD